MCISAALLQLAGVVDDVVLNREWLVWEVQLLLDLADLLGTQRRAVGCTRVHGVRCWVGDHRAQADERGAGGFGLSLLHGVENALYVLAGDLEGLPTVRLVALHHVLSEGDGGLVLDGYAVVIPEDDEVAQLLGAGDGASLARHTFLHIAIGGDDVDVVIERGLTFSSVRIEQCALAARSHRHAHCRSQSLSQWAGGDLHPVGVVHLRVARGLRTPRAQSLQVFHLEAKTTQVQLDVLRQGRVSGGKDEAIASHPVRITWVVAQNALVQGVSQRRQAHCGAWVAGSAPLHGICSQHAGEVDSTSVRLGPIFGVIAYGEGCKFRGESH